MTTWRRQRLFLPLPLLAVVGIVWPLSAPDAPKRSVGEVAYHDLPAKPAGHAGRGRDGVEPSAIALAAWLHAVPTAKDTPDISCPDDRLQVGWDALGGSDHLGAFVGPLGPVPTSATLAVNGIVVCAGSDWAFMGFQARYADGRWDVIAVPNADAGEDEHEVTTPEPVAPAAPPTPVVTLDGRTFGAAIEGLAAYEPQRTCDGTAKPGTAALRNLLLRDNPGSRNLGIVRGCSVGGQSEHKEGRAFDWGVSVNRPAEKAEAAAFIARVLATDEHGNTYALARRMGVMYLIWNQKIWSAYRAEEGWRPYHGASPHTDHVHMSISWAGALGRTSFWSGNVVEVLLASPGGGGGGKTSTGARSSRSSSGTKQQVAVQVRHDADRAARKAAWEAQQEARREAAAKRAAEEVARRQSNKLSRSRGGDQRSATTTTQPKQELTVWQRAEQRQVERRVQREAEARQRAEEAADAARAAERTARRAADAAREVARRATEQAWAREHATTTTALKPTTTTTALKPTTTTTAPKPTTTTTTPTTTTTAASGGHT